MRLTLTGDEPMIIDLLTTRRASAICWAGRRARFASRESLSTSYFRLPIE